MQESSLGCKFPMVNRIFTALGGWLARLYGKYFINLSNFCEWNEE